MNKTIQFPFQEVLRWYKKYGRHTLPWRQIYQSPTKERLYKVWVAEAMLQQTQVDRVIEYYTRFLKKFPTIESLAKTSYEELFPYWQGLGYYSRARNIIRCAQEIVDKHEGIIPDSYEKLRKLPGIGDYTARAILAFGYDKPVLSVDANLRKIFARYFFGSRHKPISEALLVQLGEQLAKTIIDNPTNPIIRGKKIRRARNDKRQTINDKLLSGRNINNALMDFGSTFTTFETTKRFKYPLKECRWYKTGGKFEIKNAPPPRHPRASSFIAKQGGTKTRGSRQINSCIVFLHKNHKEYYSCKPKKFEPFIVSPKNVDDRQTIKAYFLEKYHLHVSVRPSFGNAKYRGLSAKLFYAQIQVGTTKFFSFPKEEKNNWLKALINR